MKTPRKGFGSRSEGKVPAQVLQKLLRHASITTTMDSYANAGAAAEQALLGGQQNTTRNTQPAGAAHDQPAADAKLESRPAFD
jgi:hypothetical protein